MNIYKTISVALLSAAMLSCSQSAENRAVELRSEADTLSYIMGLSVGAKLMEADSMLNVDAIALALKEQAAGRPRISMEDAKGLYLRYLLYIEPERRRGYEIQFLKELEERDRSLTSSKSGLVYNVGVIGNEKLTPKNANDYLTLRYVISRADGEQIYSSYERGDSVRTSLGELSKGLEESVKLIGEGGKILAWIPSSMAFGEQGDKELGVAPFETLKYEIELVKNEVGMAKKYEPKTLDEL
ncbi:MAG: FKBP-type peptidyl-prolyl cis-trans isomerase [Rikenellaceae bacterium]